MSGYRTLCAGKHHQNGDPLIANGLHSQRQKTAYTATLVEPVLYTVIVRREQRATRGGKIPILDCECQALSEDQTRKFGQPYPKSFHIQPQRMFRSVNILFRFQRRMNETPTIPPSNQEQEVEEEGQSNPNPLIVRGPFGRHMDDYFYEKIKNGGLFVDLSFESLDPKEARQIAKALIEPNTIVERLDLFLNNLQSEGVVAIAKTLAINNVLKELDLGHNDIGPEGATVLAEALETNETLQVLRLSHNFIGVEGATALAKALERNKALKELSLADNSIRSEGAVALAKALKTNITLRSLDLSENEIGREGAAALAKALETNRALEELRLNDYNISDDVRIRSVS